MGMQRLHIMKDLPAPVFPSTVKADLLVQHGSTTAARCNNKTGLGMLWFSVLAALVAIVAP
jgi:hypothetical protein